MVNKDLPMLYVRKDPPPIFIPTFPQAYSSNAIATQKISVSTDALVCSKYITLDLEVY